ncbi:hypothetical protein MTO96_012649 [Rhipicephalus appendiculatus]
MKGSCGIKAKDAEARRQTTTRERQCRNRSAAAAVTRADVLAGTRALFGRGDRKTHQLRTAPPFCLRQRSRIRFPENFPESSGFEECSRVERTRTPACLSSPAVNMGAAPQRDSPCGRAILLERTAVIRGEGVRGPVLPLNASWSPHVVAAEV